MLNPFILVFGKSPLESVDRPKQMFPVAKDRAKLTLPMSEGRGLRCGMIKRPTNLPVLHQCYYMWFK